MKDMLPRPDNADDLRGLRNQIKLIWRLLRDDRVNLLLKLVPIGSFIYLLFPFDLPGPLDDAVIIGLGLYTFVEMCPDEVVAEHRQDLAAEARRRKAVDADK